MPGVKSQSEELRQHANRRPTPSGLPGAEPGNEAPTEVNSWGWTRSHQLGLGALLLIFLGLMLLIWQRRSAYWNPSTFVVSQAALGDYRINPNTADYNSLTRLPGLGPAKVRRLLAYRSEFIKQHPGKPAFASPVDIRNVRGFGKDTIEKILPFLRFTAAGQKAVPARLHAAGPPSVH